jgi:Zn-dependent peptidase ImmA (M78 family)
MDKKSLASKALNRALRIRVESGAALWEPICVYDLVEKNGVEVRFICAPSFEGLYSKEPGPIILLGSERPSVRKVFTCAHEFGHHVFAHGIRVDKIFPLERSNDPIEFLADCFGGFLLMPKLAVLHAFSTRGWMPRKATAEQVYTVASQLGVGYSTLIHHMRGSLGLLSYNAACRLLQVNVRKVRENLARSRVDSHLVVVDEHWEGQPVDLCVGDLVLSPEGTSKEGNCIQRFSEVENNILFQAESPGLGRLVRTKDAWSAFVRVSRPYFEGRSCYRHLEE